ncbi:protein-L-isoaspartate O-methyltransferase [Paenibacillus sp. Soil766]|uniref:erythromycin esterase family protein n=1 Tax=Paenibacillus sp. Soil766 TaxID=1736404 RepID=UPI0007106C14|nr:erythromycin esterase family protein [Paenibacillus sp. Soil766]KRF03376.1 protein-L-isoaspartate O-methyltransferase [Paenibacillus sp. Soil766]
MNMDELIVEQIRKQAVSLNSTDDLDVLIEAIGDKKYVLLGEATHGTSEFYKLRMELSRKLIETKGFSFIAVEGDWPSCYEVNRYVKQYKDAKPDARTVMEGFNRWPTWMWANEEVGELMDWLKKHNEDKPMAQRVGFYGLDVYSLWESMEEIERYLQEKGTPEQLALARKAFECFDSYDKEGQNYGVSAAFYGESCKDDVVKLLKELHVKRVRYDEDSEAALSAEINALVAVNAEDYYSTMVKHDAESWNVRDRHMVEALRRLTLHHGSEAKVIVWEHNTHIGDARATDMLTDGMINVGQLVREAHGEADVCAIGFGTYRGTVIAAKSWGAPMSIMQVPAAQQGSWEELMHRAGAYDQILLLNKEDPLLGHEVLGHRAIGVVYRPTSERGNYVPSVMARRYDAFLHVDESHALRPLNIEKVLV